MSADPENTRVSHEANVLHAALDGDVEQMQQLVAEMLPGERRALIEACGLITTDAGLYCDGCGQKLDRRGPFALMSRGTWHPDCAQQRLVQQQVRRG